jgi:hypothetical protein
MFFSTEKHRLIRQELAEKGEIDKVSLPDIPFLEIYVHCLETFI